MPIIPSAAKKEPGWRAPWRSKCRAAARSAIKIRYTVIGPATYSDAAGGKRITASVITAGADVIFGEGNGSSFGMLQAVEITPAQDGGKVWFIDVICDKSPIDKGLLLSSVLWNLTPVYIAMIKDLKNNQFGSHNYQTSLANGAIGLLKTPHIPDDIWAQVQAVRDRIISGRSLCRRIMTPVRCWPVNSGMADANSADTDDTLSTGAPLIRLHAVTKAFPGIIANNAISLALWPGEVHVLLGRRNGAGKSTLVALLSGGNRQKCCSRASSTSVPER